MIVDILSLGYIIVSKMIGLKKEGMGVDAESFIHREKVFQYLQKFSNPNI